MPVSAYCCPLSATWICAQAARVEVAARGAGGPAGGLSRAQEGLRCLRGFGQQSTTNDGHRHVEDQVERQSLVIGDHVGRHLDGHSDEAGRGDEAQHDVREALVRVRV